MAGSDSDETAGGDGPGDETGDETHTDETKAAKASRGKKSGAKVTRAEKPADEKPADEKPADEAPADEVAADEATGEAEGDEPPEEHNPLAIQRDEMIAPIVKTLARRLKRTLQDSQNDLLDSLRSNGSRWSTDLLPDNAEQVDSYATAALPALEEGSEAGVSFAGTSGSAGPGTDSLVGIAHDLAEALVGPLRRRLAEDEGLVDAEESVVVEHVGSAFREWKGERIERLAGDHVVAAFSAGTIAAAGGKRGAQVEWVAVASSSDEPCPDCEDNGLNGSQQPGEEFPTGHRHPPVHPGCRCLLALAAT
jgi:hypothetical protein